MGTRLIQTVSFPNVGAAATVVLPHNLNIAGTPVVPDFVAGDASNFTISATSTTVSVTNNNAGPVTINVWLQREHTTPRELGGGIANMTPQPFVVTTGGAGGGGGGTGGLGWYGTGIDGVHVTAGNETLVRDMFYSDLTVSAGDTLSTAGYRVYVSGTLTIEATGRIDNSGFLGGAGGLAGTLLGGASFVPGLLAEVNLPGVVGTNGPFWPIASPAVAGGAGGGATLGGGAAGSSVAGFGTGPYMISTMAIGDAVGGGPSGGGGAADAESPAAAGGAGGGGGGVIVLCAKTFASAGDISARGGAGSAGVGVATGGGGGGAGGAVIIVTNDAVAPGTIDVSGGAGGAGTGTGAAGAVGDAGVVIAISPTNGPL